jgi:hypothetical protein
MNGYGVVKETTSHLQNKITKNIHMFFLLKSIQDGQLIKSALFEVTICSNFHRTSMIRSSLIYVPGFFVNYAFLSLLTDCGNKVYLSKKNFFLSTRPISAKLGRKSPQTLEYRYISKLPMKNEWIWSYVRETTSHLQNKLTKNIHLGVATSTRPPFS